MAEIILSPFIEATLDRLVSVVLEELRLFSSRNTDIKKLRRTLPIILDVLADAEEKQQSERGLKAWLTQLEEAAYDADEILDQCSTEGLRRNMLETEGHGFANKVRDFFSDSNPLLFDIRMAHKIKDIRQRFEEIADNRVKYCLNPIIKVKEARNREEMGPYVKESYVRGREEDQKNIVEQLLDKGKEKKVWIISVVGMGGLGKTTLAQLIYNDARIKQHFPLRIWVCVSDDYDMKKLIRKIIESASQSSVSDPENVELLQNNLRQKLSGKKFFLVLDDVWYKEGFDWELLKCFLEAGEMGSKILVTTRSEQDAVEKVGTHEVYRLNTLSDDECWDLFHQQAFPRGLREEDENFIGIGKEIVKKCGGLPLAVKAIGGLMRSKREESEWKAVIESEIWKTIVTEKRNNILPALQLSYNDLPSHLKACFAYYSIFPKDYKINVKDLIRLWMAEGLILPSQGNRPMESIGGEYFQNLLWRSFFQEAETDDDGGRKIVVWCKMHDLMHDLAETVSKDAHSISSEDCKIPFPDGCRGLSVDMCYKKHEKSITFNTSNSAKKLKTLLILNSSHDTLLHNCFTNLPSLRVLSLGYNVKVTKDTLNSISGLKQLRYLCLSISNITTLPNSWSNLLNLQTLRLINSGQLKELPKDMSKMKSLRHLHINWKNLTHMPAKMGELISLQTLPLFIVGKDSECGIAELKDLRQLKGRLEIKQLENVRDKSEAQKAELSEKANIDSLTLEFSKGNVDLREYSRDEEILEALQPHSSLRELVVSNYYGKRLPHWMSTGSSLPNLVQLSLINWRGWEEEKLHLHFGRLLRFLYVDHIDGVKHICGDFRNLEKLILEDLGNLEEWSGGGGCNAQVVAVLPRLKHLTVRGCPKLIEMPYFDSLSSLELSGFEAESLPNCFFRNQLNHLLTLRIESCKNLESLSRELRNLGALQKLDIKDCPKLVSLFPDEEWSGEGGCNDRAQAAVHPRLKELTVRGCPKLIEMPSFDSLSSLEISGFEAESLPNCFFRNQLNHLLTLRIGNCKNLESLSWRELGKLGALKELKIDDCPKLVSLFPDDDDNNQMQCRTCLQSLSIIRCDGLKSLRLDHFIALKTVKFHRCRNLTSFAGEMRHCLTALQSIEIIKCGGVGSLLDGMEYLTSLRYLNIISCDQLRSLPEALKHATQLEHLDLQHLPNLSALPDWIGNLFSVFRLLIYNCPNLVSLPSNGFQQLTNLKNLLIYGCCDELAKRCEKEKGEDWHKISHIQNVKIYPRCPGSFLDAAVDGKRRWLNTLCPATCIGGGAT